MAFPNLGPAFHQTLEGFEIALCLACQTDLSEYRDAVTKRFVIDIRMIAADIARIFQRPYAAQTGRCRNTDSFRQFDISHPPIVLQIAEDFTVDFIKFYAFHR